MPTKPSVVSIDELEAYAVAHLPKFALDYFDGGSMDAITLKDNRREYARYYIRPRVLRNVSNIDTTTKAFPDGHSIPFPCCVAPSAMQKMAHALGEVGTARASGRFGTVMGLSTFSTTSLEDVKIAADQARSESGKRGDSECVLQIYLFRNRQTSLSLIRRAEQAGYKAIVLTVDTPFFGRRLSEIRNAFRLPAHLTMANFDPALDVKTGSEHRTDEIQARKNDKPSASSRDNANSGRLGNTLDPSLTWEAVEFLKRTTSLPIWVKGVMTPDDALLAVDHGVDAIIVSNHGGRQLDGCPPTLRVLEDIVKVIDGQVPVHFDGGIRRGSDIFKALCLGADMVWIGRPILWGLAYDGQHGVANALSVLQEEFQQCMGLAGCITLEDLCPERLMAVDSKL